MSGDRGVFSAAPAAFEAQVGLLKHECDVISPADLDGVVQSRRGRHVLITFDDGYRDNFDVAFPILRAHDVAATFFVGTGFLDHQVVSWWDEVAWMVRESPSTGIPSGKWLSAPVPFDAPHRERAIRTLLSVCKSLPADETERFLDHLAEATGTRRCQPSDARDLWMTWDMVRIMRRAGMTIGGHGVRHRILGHLAPREQEQELTECGDRFRVELGEPIRSFSYPEGSKTSFNAATRACLRRQGIDYGFSFYGGYSRFDGWDPYDIRRTSVMMETTPELLRATLDFPRFFT